MHLLHLLAGTTGGLDLRLSASREVLRPHNQRDVRELAAAGDLEETVLADVDHWDRLAGLLLSSLIADLLRDESPELVDVDGRVPLAAREEVEVPHADLPEVAGVVAIEPRPLVVHAAGVTVAAWRLPVLSDTAVAHRLVAAEFPALLEAGWHEKGQP